MYSVSLMEAERPIPHKTRLRTKQIQRGGPTPQQAVLFHAHEGRTLQTDSISTEWAGLRPDPPPHH